MTFRTALLAWIGLLWAPLASADVPERWPIAAGKVELAFLEGPLTSLGLEVVGPARTIRPDTGDLTGLEPPVFAFAVEPDGLAFHTSGGRPTGFDGDAALRVPVRGGLSIRAEDPRTKRALPPALLYDFTLEIDPRRDWAVSIVSADPTRPRPIGVRNARVGVDSRRNALVVVGADLVVSPSWAAALGRPALAGRIIGALDLRLDVTGARRIELPEPTDTEAARSSAVLDVELLEIFGLTDLGRDGTYPTGQVGLSAATSACNPGDIPVPWQLANQDSLIEEHPFIGLALFREDSTGVLEMIGRSWTKHGFFTVDGLDCIFTPEDTCFSGGTTHMGVGCADTYGVNNNGSRYFLGPREEVDPLNGTWTALGSFFDATPVDGYRHYFGNESSNTAHRIECADTDLANPGASYYFEGTYYVRDDVDYTNNVGWERSTITVDSTGAYTFADETPGNQLANPGPVVTTWGDLQVEQQIAGDDGTVWLAVDVTDLGGGQWHYEYALYNFTSRRGVRSFAVPTGAAGVTNVGFHDFDLDGANDWTATVSPGNVRWETDDFATDPNAPMLGYQAMSNFRFDADVAPLASSAQCGIFLPGLGTTFDVATQAPAGGATDVSGTRIDEPAFALLAAEPNPFRHGAQVAFSLDRRRETRLSVIDVTGRTVRVLWDGTAPAGRSVATWDGRDATGARAAAGVYFFRMQSGGAARTLKGTLLQ